MNSAEVEVVIKLHNKGVKSKLVNRLWTEPVYTQLSKNEKRTLIDLASRHNLKMPVRVVL